MMMEREAGRMECPYCGETKPCGELPNGTPCCAACERDMDDTAGARECRS
jgi:hypothetical protein